MSEEDASGRATGRIVFALARAVRPVLLTLAAVIVLVVALLGYLYFFGGPKVRTPEIWQFQVGTKGWIVVEYGRPTCPPIERSGDSLVYRIPRSGTLCTSDSFPEGIAKDRFEYVLSNGFRVPILEDQARQIRFEGTTQRLLLFIGTADEQEAALKTTPEGFR